MEKTAGGGAEEVGRADLAAFEDDLYAVGWRAGRGGSAERGSGRERGEHFQGLDAERAAGVAGGIATGDEQTAKAAAGDHLAREAAKRGADQFRRKTALGAPKAGVGDNVFPAAERGDDGIERGRMVGCVGFEGETGETVGSRPSDLAAGDG